MRKKHLASLVGLVLATGYCGAVQAALTTIGTATYQGNDYKLIYDAESPSGPITWLDYRKGDSDWYTQMNWAAGLNIAGTLTVNLNPGFTANWSQSNIWRLPVMVDGPVNNNGNDGTTVSGYNITSSELGHLYYTELGNKGWYDINGKYQDDNGWKNVGPFVQLPLRADYWSSTEYALQPSQAWFFAGAGTQSIFFKSGFYYSPWGEMYFDKNSAIAVLPGEVSAVPVPAAIWLLGSGIVGLAGSRFRRRK